MLTTLYDEAVKRVNRSKVALEANQEPLFLSELTRAVEIILYLDGTLDDSYEISRNLHSLYEYMTYEINKVRVTKKYDNAQQVCDMLIELKNIFMQANASIAKK